MWLRCKRWVKNLLPHGLVPWLEARKQGAGERRCPVCQKRVPRFARLDDDYLARCDAHQVPWSLFTFETLNVREYSCPACGSPDRVRLYALYLRRHFLPGWAGRGECHVLDIAPNEPLSRLFRSVPFVRYRSADLFSPLADDRVDVMDMGLYADGRFDLVLCSHVLEHVADDRTALREIRRVMKTGAKAILMVPIDLSRSETDEDPAVRDDAVQWRRFGQDDHVRAYSRSDFLGRLAEAGFRVEQLGQGFFGEGAFRAHGIHPRSVLYVAEKT